MTIGEKIADLRKKNNMTQRDLAELINISDKVISNWETGRSLPDVESMMRLSKTFNVTVGELYECIEHTDTDKAEDYNEERLWQYKKYSIISYACLLALPLLHEWFGELWSTNYGTYQIAMEALYGLWQFRHISALILFASAIVLQIVNFIKLYTYSKKKHYQSEYKKTLIVYSAIFGVLFATVLLKEIF